MSDDLELPAGSAWRWPLQWVREEKFWRDIGSRVLAGVLTAAIIYLGAVVLGYLHTPEIGAGLLVALRLAAAALLGAIGAVLLRSVVLRSRSGRPRLGRLVASVLVLLAALVLVLTVVADLL